MRGSKMWILWCFWDFILVMKLNTNSWNSTKLLFFPNDICKVFLKRKQQNLKKLPFLLNNSLSIEILQQLQISPFACVSSQAVGNDWRSVSSSFELVPDAAVFTYISLCDFSLKSILCLHEVCLEYFWTTVYGTESLSHRRETCMLKIIQIKQSIKDWHI